VHREAPENPRAGALHPDPVGHPAVVREPAVATPVVLREPAGAVALPTVDRP
jgi:hypothetical protein